MFRETNRRDLGLAIRCARCSASKGFQDQAHHRHWAEDLEQRKCHQVDCRQLCQVKAADNGLDHDVGHDVPWVSHGPKEIKLNESGSVREMKLEPYDQVSYVQIGLC